MNPFNLESVYDAEISPLMAQILEVCKKHNLPMCAEFLYKNDEEGEQYCTSYIGVPESVGISDHMEELWQIIKPRKIPPASRFDRTQQGRRSDADDKDSAMNTAEKNLIMQAGAFARVFVKEADRASAGLPNEMHEAADQLRAALEALPPSITGCTCRCVEFNEVKENPCR